MERVQRHKNGANENISCAGCILETLRSFEKKPSISQDFRFIKKKEAKAQTVKLLWEQNLSSIIFPHCQL